MCFVVFYHRLIKKTRHSAGARGINMKTLMILTAALATAFVSGFFTAPTAYANDVPKFCSEVSFCTVFTTSTFHQGNLNGLAGADAICNARAAEASLPGIYMAWLADQTGSPSTRFVQSTVPYMLTDGATVANSYNALVTDGTLQHAIDLDESGFPVPLGEVNRNWTHVTTEGTAGCGVDCGQFHCTGWTTNAISPHFGNTGAYAETDSQWTEGGAATCDVALQLYCFEQPQTSPPIPTISQWGMIIMVGVLGLSAVIGLFVMRTRRTVAGGRGPDGANQ